MRTTVLLIAIASFGSPATQLLAAGPHTHAHGRAELEVTIQTGQVEGIFRTPMDNLLGFEHAPKTDAQKKRVEQLRQRLENTASLFRPNAEAQCAAKTPEARSPLFQGRGDAGHSDLEYRFGFACKRPELLKQIEVALFADYPRLHEIQSQLVTPTAQMGITLRRNSRLLKLQ